jgi:hypothetical protein
MNRQIYRLNFSSVYFRFHNIFHISLFEPYYNRRGRILVIFKPIFIEEQDEWAVEQILMIKIRKDRFRKYLIR